MSTDMVRVVVEEGTVEVSDDSLWGIIDDAISKLKEVRLAIDFPLGINHPGHVRRVVEILRNYAHADMHVGSRSSFTRREKLEWAAGQILAAVDEDNFHLLNMVLNQLRDFLKVNDSDDAIILPPDLDGPTFSRR